MMKLNTNDHEYIIVKSFLVEVVNLHLSIRSSVCLFVCPSVCRPGHPRYMDTFFIYLSDWPMFEQKCHSSVFFRCENVKQHFDINILLLVHMYESKGWQPIWGNSDLLYVFTLLIMLKRSPHCDRQRQQNINANIIIWIQYSFNRCQCLCESKNETVPYSQFLALNLEMSFVWYRR